MESIASLFGQTEQELAREITDKVRAQLPEEKAQIEREMLATARELRARGSCSVEGLGQVKYSVPPLLFMRWAQLVPGFWQDDAEVDAFLHDNPQCCGPGYKPKAHSLRHSFTFSSTQYSKLKHLAR